jgi:glucose dehydrogenase
MEERISGSKVIVATVFESSSLGSKSSRIALRAAVILALFLLVVPAATIFSSAAYVGNPSSTIAPTNLDWRYFGNDPGNMRFQNIYQINSQNINKLKVAWVFRTGVDDAQSSFEVSPIEVGGVIYFSTPHDDVFALNAATGKEIWSYHPESEMPPFSLFVNEGAVVANRGVAYGDGMVFLARLDCVLVALNAQNGKVVWQHTVANYRAGHFMTMARSLPTAWF